MHASVQGWPPNWLNGYLRNFADMILVYPLRFFTEKKSDKVPLLVEEKRNSDFRLKSPKNCGSVIKAQVSQAKSQWFKSGLSQYFPICSPPHPLSPVSFSNSDTAHMLYVPCVKPLTSEVAK